MTRARVVGRVSEKELRGAIHRLSGRLRQNRGLLYEVAAAPRTLLIAVMIDPEASWLKLRGWAIHSDQIPTWDAAIKLAATEGVDLKEWCRAQRWDVDGLHQLYDRLRALKGELMAATP